MTSICSKQTATTEGQVATIDGQGQSSNKATPSQDTGKQSRKRKYNEEYIKYGFAVTTDRAGEEVPMCFVCSTLLSTEAIKPSKLLRHMETHHVFLNAKPTCNRYYVIFIRLKFWISCQTEFPELAANAMRCLLPFQIPVGVVFLHWRT